MKNVLRISQGLRVDEVARSMRGMLALEPLGYENFYVLPNQFVSPIAEKALRLRVHGRIRGSYLRRHGVGPGGGAGESTVERPAGRVGVDVRCARPHPEGLHRTSRRRPGAELGVAP